MYANWYTASPGILLHLSKNGVYAHFWRALMKATGLIRRIANFQFALDIYEKRYETAGDLDTQKRKMQHRLLDTAVFQLCKLGTTEEIDRLSAQLSCMP
jgi:hypothetical protein